MGATRQLIEVADVGLGDPAARAQERPLQIQKSGADRLQAELDHLALRAAPGTREAQGPDVPEVDLLRAEDQLREAAGEPMPVRRRLEPPDHAGSTSRAPCGRRGGGKSNGVARAPAAYWRASSASLVKATPARLKNRPERSMTLPRRPAGSAAIR
jgi:hypothetical protein